jgi:hypothetical protein
VKNILILHAQNHKINYHAAQSDHLCHLIEILTAAKRNNSVDQKLVVAHTWMLLRFVVKNKRSCTEKSIKLPCLHH